MNDFKLVKGVASPWCRGRNRGQLRSRQKVGGLWGFSLFAEIRDGAMLLFVRSSRTKSLDKNYQREDSW